MDKTGTPVELKDIKPGDVVRAEYQRGSTLLTAAGPVKEVRLNLSDVVFGIGDESGLSFWLGSDYYLLSRPEKVIDKEDLRLGQRVRIKMDDGNIYEGEVVGLYLNLPNKKRLVSLDGVPSGRNGSTCMIEYIAKVTLLS